MKYDSEEYRKFEQERIAAGKLIDLATAKMTWDQQQIYDPYGVQDDLPKEMSCIGPVFFLSVPNGYDWVSPNELPDATRREFWQLLRAGCYSKGIFNSDPYNDLIYFRLEAKSP